MFSYHFKKALKSIFHRKFYTAIGVLSLAIGMTVSILILSFVNYENSFDAMHDDSERIHRLNWISGDGSHFATFNNPLSPVLATALPEIENFTRIAMTQRLFTVDGVSQFKSLSMVDDGFFEMFNYEVLAGDPSSAIKDVGSAVITEAAALELFAEARPVGEVFSVDGTFDFRVAAIIANNPGNSHLVSNVYVNVENAPAVYGFPQLFSFMNSDIMYHYVKFAEGISPITAQENAISYVRENISSLSNHQISLQPLRDIHFTTDLQNEMSTRDDVSGVVKPLRQRSDLIIFAGVAFLTLLIAALNFMNLQAVQLSKRAREIGVKRIAGSSRTDLAAQFLTEIGIISLFAFFASLILCELFMPYFNSMVAARIESESFFTVINLSFLLMMALGVGILAGIYPAITAAKLSPANALRGQVVKGVSANRFRSGLIVAQFSISIGLIIASGIVNTQISYAMSKSLGFDPENVIAIELPNAQARDAYSVMREQLLSNPGVISVSAASVIPTRDLSDGRSMVREGGDPDNALRTRSIAIAEDYFEVLGMEFVAGRALSDDFPTDRAGSYSETVTTVLGGIVLNETAARQAGWNDPQDAIGKRFYNEGTSNGVLLHRDIVVVGVVQDAHYQSVRTDIAPISYILDNNLSIMTVKLADGNQASTLAAIDQIWQQNVSEYPILRSYLSDSYSAFYSGENRTFVLFIGLSLIAIMIACLGLYALASFAAERRTKEISIRKVLGATVRSIAGLLAWDFSKLVILANIIAWPLAWWSMQQWLANFAYRTDINIAVFFLAGVATFLMALATTFQRAYSVAVSNPVDSLRAE